ncbi:MAG TPA: hypothetical protein VGS23_08435, partial [Thermoplasmata archaeon]|nr:hypothetical protein [Thermoplasmata archaeon]
RLIIRGQLSNRVMSERPSGQAVLDALPNRCRCGHFPTSHMRAVPIDVAHPEGGYQLLPVGPCRDCGEGACPRYARAP